MRCPRCGDTMKPGPPTWAADVCEDCAAELGEVRPAPQPTMKELIAKSSIGHGLADIKERGIDAHLADLEREFPNRRSKQ